MSEIEINYAPYQPTAEEVVLPPLDEEVIKGLALLGLDQMVGVDNERAKQFEDAFDQWLAEVKAQERQKLIAELEQEQIYAERASRRPDDEPYVWGFRKAVAVAKGETE